METLNVSFRPRTFDKVFAPLLLVLGLAQLAIGAVMAMGPPRSSIACDRATQSCVRAAAGLFATGPRQTLAIVALRASRVEAVDSGTRWVMAAGDRQIVLGNPTHDRARIAEYTRLAGQLQAFLDDPAHQTFSVEYAGLGGPPSWIFLGVGVVLTGLALRWIRGWSADLTFDRAAGTLGIAQRPTLGLGAGARTVPLAQVARVEATGGDILLGGGVVRTLTLRLLGPEGQTVFRRRVALDGSSRVELAAKVRAMKELLAGS